MQAMRVIRLIVHAQSRQPVLLLGEQGGERCLPVFLRQPHADLIAVGPRAEKDPPLPVDMMLPVLTALGHEVDGVEITTLRDSVFSAVLVVDGEHRVEVRPSDALALAVREELPIGVAEDILDSVGQPIAELFPDGTDQPPEKQLADFREFLDDVSPDDFRAPDV